MSFLGLLVVLVAVTVPSITAYPSHASCRVTWAMPSVNCTAVGSKLTAQMKMWETADNCAQGGEKCLYKVKTFNATSVMGTHTTPVKHYVDDLTFTLTTSGSGCDVMGYSRSETWYAYLDYGTNYCNLNNLITGSGLDKTTDYKETTSDNICTQFSSADCTKY